MGAASLNEDPLFQIYTGYRLGLPSRFAASFEARRDSFPSEQHLWVVSTEKSLTHWELSSMCLSWQPTRIFSIVDKSLCA